ncbi:MAG: hypothetical protein ABII27_01870 [bacterium]
MTKSIKSTFHILSKRKLSILLSIILSVVISQIYVSAKKPEAQRTLRISLTDRDIKLYEDNSTESVFWNIQLVNLIKLQLDVWRDLFNEDAASFNFDDLKRHFSVDQNNNVLIVEIKAQSNTKVKKASELFGQLYTEVKVLELSAPVQKEKETVQSQITALQKEIEAMEVEKVEYRENNPDLKNDSKYDKELKDLRSQYKKARQIYTEQHPKIVQLNNKIASLRKKISSLPKLQNRLSEIDSNIKALRGSLAALINRLEDLTNYSINTSSLPVIEDTNQGRSIEEQKYIITGIGLLIGLFIGLLLAFTSENYDTSMESIRDIENYLQLPVLGTIPHIERRVKKTKALPNLFTLRKYDRLGTMRSRLIFLHPQDSPFSEEYQTMISKYFLKQLYVQSNVLLFSSSDFNEGKSVTACNVGIVTASMDKKVLIVEADFERPSINRVFDVPRNPGLTDCVIGNTPWRSIVKKIVDYNTSKIYSEKFVSYPGIRNLDIITFGQILKDNNKIFNSPRIPQIISEMKAIYDLVIFDCSPILRTNDVFKIAKYTQGVILVYQVGKIYRGALKRAHKLLSRNKINVSGVILNDVPFDEYYRLINR